MTFDAILLVAAVATPLAALVLCAFKGLRALLPFASVPALVAALLVPEGTMVRLPGGLLGLTFELDDPGALLLGGAALLWTIAGIYAWSFREGGNERRFTVWWLATMSGSFGVFIVADIVGFYLFFTLVSLSAYWIIVHDETAAVRRAGAVYVAFALLSEAFLLIAFVLLAIDAPGDSLLIRDAVSAPLASSMSGPALAFLVLGFGMKMGLVPMHVWMPLTYSAAPIPVAAVLSGAAVKAGVIGLIRFLPFDSALPEWGHILVVAGFASAFYGVIVGVTQTNPRAVLAYSSISQMGVIAAVLGMGLAAGNSDARLLGAFYGLHHLLVKGGLFLALGVASGRRQTWFVLAPAAFIALGLAGLPFTGGALAKFAVKDVLGDGAAGICGALSAVGSTVLMFHFIRRMVEASRSAAESALRPALISWLAIAVCAVAVPWTLYSFATDQTPLDALSPIALWASAWPILVGALLAFALERSRRMIPSVPPGDIIVAGQPLARMASAVASGIERVDRRLNQWPIAGALFLLITAMLAVAMLMSRWT